MTMRRLFALLSVLALLTVLAACSKDDPAPTTTAATEPPITAEYLYENLKTAAVDSPMTGAESETNMDVVMNFPSVDMSMTTSSGVISTHIYSADGLTSYAESTMGTSAYGEMTTENLKEYTVTEDGKRVTYSYNETTELWSRASSGRTMQAFLAALIEPDTLILEEAQEDLNGKQVYVLHATFVGNKIADYVGDVSSLVAELPDGQEDAEVDMSAVSAEVTYYLDAETLLPAQCDASLSGLDEAMGELWVEAIQASLEESREELGEEYAAYVQMYRNMTITIPTYTITFLDISYGPVTVPELPEEARESVALMEYDPLQADGTYVLKQIGASVTFTPPENWTVTDADHHMVLTQAPDGYNELRCWLIANTDEQEIQEGFDGTAAIYQEYDLYQSHSLGDVVNGWQTGTITCDPQTHVYIAWKQAADDVWVWVECYDYYGASMKNTLIPRLDTIVINPS